jgi:hypothetical protein
MFVVNSSHAAPSRSSPAGGATCSSSAARRRQDDDGPACSQFCRRSFDEAVDVTTVHSVAVASGRHGTGRGAFSRAASRFRMRRWCNGPPPRPGRFVDWRTGVLFLDEMPEFSRRAQCAPALLEGSVTIARAAH